MRRSMTSLDLTSSTQSRLYSSRTEAPSTRKEESSMNTMQRVSSETCLVDFPRTSPRHSQDPSKQINEAYHPAKRAEYSVASSSNSTNDSQGSRFQAYFSQLTEKKETSRHSAMEKGLIRQLELAKAKTERVVAEYEFKIRQRDEAIETLEKMVILKDDTVHELRAKLEKVQRKYEKEKQRRADRASYSPSERRQSSGMDGDPDRVRQERRSSNDSDESRRKRRSRRKSVDF